MTPPKVILITSCSSTRTVIPQVRVGDLPTGLTIAGALKEWMNRLNSQEAQLTPRELYRGLGFTTLVKLQEQFPVQAVKIITGGQGLIDMDEKIVPYDFTAHPKEPENIHQKVTAEPFVQVTWWRMINQARGKAPNPIATLVQDEQDSFVIISASKIFLRYCADDILSIPFNMRDKVRILLTASSLGSVPAQLRPMIISFDRSFVGGIPGNRNDANHRAALRFIEMLQDESFASLGLSKQLKVIDDMGPDAGAKDGTSPQTDLIEFLRARPNYLDMDIESAYKLTRRVLGNVGGRLYFRSLVRQLKGADLTSAPQDVEDGVEALRGLGNFFTASESTPTHHEEAALKGLKVFVDSVKQVVPDAVFNAADVCRWSETYFKKRGEPLPAMMESPNKLSFVLKNNSIILGLLPEGKGYRINTLK